jgi:hypothetical protein
MLRSSAWALVTPPSRCLSTLQMQWQRQLLAWPPVRDTVGETAKGIISNSRCYRRGSLRQAGRIPRGFQQLLCLVSCCDLARWHLKINSGSSEHTAGMLAV